MTAVVGSEVNGCRTLRVGQAAVFAIAESAVSQIDGLVTKTKVGYVGVVQSRWLVEI